MAGVYKDIFHASGFKVLVQLESEVKDCEFGVKIALQCGVQVAEPGPVAWVLGSKMGIVELVGPLVAIGAGERDSCLIMLVGGLFYQV